MSNLGLGVMLGLLGGNEQTVQTLNAAIGKVIVSVELNVTTSDEDELIIEVEGGYKFKLFDSGQSCCESRYMGTDDDLSSFVGDTLLGFELKEAPDVTSEYGDHEVQFLQVNTSKGCFTMSSHNEHNGYYGGFNIVARPID